MQLVTRGNFPRYMRDTLVRVGTFRISTPFASSTHTLSFYLERGGSVLSPFLSLYVHTADLPDGPTLSGSSWLLCRGQLRIPRPSRTCPPPWEHFLNLCKLEGSCSSPGCCRLCHSLRCLRNHEQPSDYSSLNLSEWRAAQPGFGEHNPGLPGAEGSDGVARPWERKAILLALMPSSGHVQACKDFSFWSHILLLDLLFPV